MATIVDQVEKMAKDLRSAAIDSRRIRFATPSAQIKTKPRPEIDALEFRRRGV